MIINHIGAVARQQGLNARTLAERAGLAYNTAHGLFTGRSTRIDLETLNRLCTTLQVQPGHLLEWAPDQPAADQAGQHTTDGG
jgi:DNA-binding Xre family transcriptional regulator